MELTGAREMSVAFDDPTRLIDDFRGQWGFLSNFHPSKLWFEGDEYRSAEAAFNAGKTLDPRERARVRAAYSPAKAKVEGRRVTLRPGWDETVRFEVMKTVVDAKFLMPGMADKLLLTGDALLVEGNVWCDQTWGDCRCETHFGWPGQNMLGRILMAERAATRRDRPERYVRVAVTGHRRMERDEERFARTELDRLAVKLRDRHDTTVAISGMAVGADTWWADAAANVGLDVWAYVPFLAQPDRWPSSDQRTWHGLLESAQRCLVLGDDYDVRLLHARNHYMIRDADLLVAVVDPNRTSGGTAAAIEHAKAQGTPLVFVDVAARRTYRLRR